MLRLRRSAAALSLSAAVALSGAAAAVALDQRDAIARAQAFRDQQCYHTPGWHCIDPYLVKVYCVQSNLSNIQWACGGAFIRGRNGFDASYNQWCEWAVYFNAYGEYRGGYVTCHGVEDD